MLIPDSYSEIKFPAHVEILKFRIDDDLCDDLIDAAAPYQVEGINCNLFDSKRTGWFLHKEYDFLPVFQRFTRAVSKVISSYLENRSDHFPQITATYLESWVAWYGDDSFVAPHSHDGASLFSGMYSLSAYLKVPNKVTNLSFMDGSIKRSYEVRKGDVLIFPSSIIHYCNDCHSGRTILSSNMRLGYNEGKND